MKSRSERRCQTRSGVFRCDYPIDHPGECETQGDKPTAVSEALREECRVKLAARLKDLESRIDSAVAGEQLAEALGLIGEATLLVMPLDDERWEP